MSILAIICNAQLLFIPCRLSVPVAISVPSLAYSFLFSPLFPWPPLHSTYKATHDNVDCFCWENKTFRIRGLSYLYLFSSVSPKAPFTCIFNASNAEIHVHVDKNQ